MKSCVDCAKKYWWLFLLIFLLYPLVMFSELLWLTVVKFFSIVEEISREYKHSLQLLQALGIFGIIFSWWKWKKEEREKEERSLSSISFVDVDDNAVATIQNTSSSSNSILRVEVYRPANFEKAESETSQKYTAHSEEKYEERATFLRDTSNWENKNICWEKILEAELFIGEKTSFHIKNVADEDGGLVHFAPIKIEIYFGDKDFKPKIKHVLFRYVSKKFQNNKELGKDKYHPYGKWIRLM